MNNKVKNIMLILLSFWFVTVDMSMVEVNPAYYNQGMSGDVTGGLTERTRAIIENQIMNLEGSGFMYRPMFSDEVLQMVSGLIYLLERYFAWGLMCPFYWRAQLLIHVYICLDNCARHIYM